MEFPVGYIENNIVVTPSKEFWCGYEILGFQYAYKSKSKQRDDFKRLLSNVFASLQHEYRILLLPKVYSFKQHFESLADRASGPFKEYAKVHAADTRDMLVDALGRDGSHFQAYLFVKLGSSHADDDITETIKQTVSNVANNLSSLISRFSGFSGLEIRESEMERIKNLEKQIYQKYGSNSFKKGPSLKRLLESDIDWIVKRNFWKGIGQPPKSYLFQNDRRKYDIYDQASKDQFFARTGRKKADIVEKGKHKIIRPRQVEYLKMTEGMVSLTDKRVVELTQNVNDELKKGYVSYLTISEMGDGFPVPGGEWLKVVQDEGFPIGVSIFVTPTNPEQAKGKIKNKKMDFDDQEKHTLEADFDIPYSLIEAAQDAKELEKLLDDTKYPLLDINVTFEVFSDSQEKTLEYRNLLIGMYKSYFDMELVCPAGMQLDFFNQFIPGARPISDKDYMSRVDPQVMAASMIGATNDLGDSEGYFIGTDQAGKPVFFNPAAAPKRNRSASATFSGTLGGGKSYTANFLGGYLTPLYGGKCLIVDPKGDRNHWQKHLKEFEGELEFVTLDDRIEDAGKLDPFGYLEPKEAGRVALDLITYLANIKTDDDRYISASEAVNTVQHSNKKSMYQIIKILENSPDEDVQRLARSLNAYRRAPFGQLIFHDGEIESIKLEKQITILQVNNLDLPDEHLGRDEYTMTNILSVGVMFPIARFCIKFSMQPEFTVVLFDEAWALIQTKQGKSLTDRLIRTGRSYNAAVFLVTQNVKDLESMKTNIGIKFIFRVEDNEEITEVLNYLGLEDTIENRNLIESIQPGVPVMQDLDDRVGLVDINVMYEHVHNAFDTTPKDIIEIADKEEVGVGP